MRDSAPERFSTVTATTQEFTKERFSTVTATTQEFTNSLLIERKRSHPNQVKKDSLFTKILKKPS
jgi:hypothetical protein